MSREVSTFLLQFKKDELTARGHNAVSIHVQLLVWVAMDKNGLNISPKTEENYDGL